MTSFRIYDSKSRKFYQQHDVTWIFSEGFSLNTVAAGFLFFF